MLSLLTVNIQAAALARAKTLVRWLDDRPEDVFVLSETSGGTGTAHLLESCRQAGMSVIAPVAAPGDRGVALVSRLELQPRPELHAAVDPIGRTVAADIDTDTGALTVVGIYVPSSDRAAAKVARKRTFLTTLLEALHAVPAAARQRLVLGGDYNVVTRDHEPRYPGFLPFEYDFLDALTELGLIDAHDCHRPGVQAHSWLGRSGNGYRFDYWHIAAGLCERLAGCDYVHEPRIAKFTDHAAVTLALDVTPARRQQLDPAGLAAAGALF